MPQKKNPDAAELIRGKVGRINGSLVSLLTVMKGLPLAYSKDLQEDKERVFDSADTLLLSIRAMTGMINDLEPQVKNLRKAADIAFSTATDLADWLVKEIKISFREAHGITGQIVKIAHKKNCKLAELSLQTLQAVEPRIEKAVFEILTVENSVNSRNSYGGTAPIQVKKQIDFWSKKLDE
jgi:argininosuccinate lyase